MAYIGNQILNSAFPSDTFSGNGSTTAFTMSIAPANTTSMLIAISGVLQAPSTYSVSGTTLTFSAAPPSGTSNISIIYLGVPASGITNTAYRTVTEFTATAGQTTFTPPSYTVGFINVYQNGVLLGSADYTATTGTTVVLALGALVGDLVTVESFLVSSVLNAIPNTSGSISSSNLPSGLTITSPTLVTPALGTPSSGTLTNCTGYPASALPTGSVLQVVQGSYNTEVSTTSSTFIDTGITASITPSSSSNKILVLMSVGYLMQDTNLMGLRLLRGATVLQTSVRVAHALHASYYHNDYLDSPATTSSTTYKIQFNKNTGNAAATCWNSEQPSTITLLEIKG